MTWRQKIWTILLTASILALVLTVSVAAVTSPVPVAPEPTLTGNLAPGVAADPALEPRSGGAPAQNEAGARTASVAISARVEAVRLLVVDEEGRITEIWSNTGSTQIEPLVSARLGSAEGPTLTVIPESSLDEYRFLLTQVDWSMRGLVYVSG